MSYQNIRLDFEGSVALLTLADPKTLNAMTISMLAETAKALDAVLDPARNVRCLIVTGEGRGFSSGANLSGSGAPDGPPGASSRLILETYIHPVLRRMRDLPFPLITAVNGIAAGVGMSIALMGDLILAAESASFLQAFSRIGLVPDGGSTWLLPRLIGLARAKELSLLAEKLPAAKALEWGLINRVYPDAELMPNARALATQLAQGPTAAYNLTRQLYRDSLLQSYEEQLHQECMSQMAARRTEDSNEGTAAFLEKRPANFQGK